MNRNNILLTALAIGAAVMPPAVQARHSRRIETAQQVGVQRTSSLLSPAVPLTLQDALPPAPFNARLIDRAATIKTRSASHDWLDGSLTLNIMRVKSQRLPGDLPALNFNRYAAMATDIGMVRDISGRDTLSLGLSYALENRRPSMNIAAHNIYRTSNVAATLGWTHDSAFRLSTSLFATKPNYSRSMPERLLELAGGAPLSAQGVSLTASFSPVREQARLNYGIDIKRQNIASGDAGLFGAPSGHSDTRFGLFVRTSF